MTNQEARRVGRPESRKAGLVRLVLAMLLLGVPAGSVFAQQSVVLVRHAERADSKPGAAPAMASDPDLSDAGRARAAALVAMLKDAKIAAIVATEYKRTQQTGEPLAKVLGLPVTPIKASDTANIVKAVRAASGNVLVVGHSNTIPDIIKALGAPPPEAIGDDEYDNLYIVTLGTTPAVVRLHFKP
jgi:broad specificity phosphatase PhoE